MQATANPPTMWTPAPARMPSGPRWLHGLAVLTVIAACAPIFLGAEVTTKGVGMADQRSLVNPLQALGELEGQSLGFQLEHSHRLAGWLVGFCGILLAGSLWLLESRRWVRWLGLAALLMIAGQGLLGIFRVQLNAILGPSLAWTHGSFAPLVLATLVSVGVVTSHEWVTGGIVPSDAAGTEPRSIRAWAIGMGLVVYLQIILGGMVRHQPTLLAARLHLLGAFIVVAGLLWLVRISWHNVGCRYANRIILGLLGLQILLGIEAWFSWMKRFFLPLAAQDESILVHLLRSGHYVVGALIFSGTIVVALQARRPQPEAAP